MAMFKHINVFGYVDNKTEAYAALQRDIKRDRRAEWFWCLVLIGSAVGAAYFGGRFDWLWLFAGIGAAVATLECFIDNSNRNWAMHVIDWLEHNGGES